MKIYQSLKPQGLALLMVFITTVSLIMMASFGGLALLTPQLILLLVEFTFIMYGFVFGRTHLSYCAPETHGYKYFRSIPNFESHFRKQCIVSDIVCYGIGYAVTILNFIFTFA